MAIKNAIDAAKERKDKATCIVLDTTKGQGVKYFEELFGNHSVNFNAEMDEVADKAIAELEAFIAQEA